MRQRSASAAVAMSGAAWASSRKQLEQIDGLQDTYAYEERLMLWQAESFDEAISLAEAEGREYCEVLPPAEYLGIAQAYELPDPPAHGVEVFSFIRQSQLEPRTYVDQFFDTGEEYQGHVE